MPILAADLFDRTAATLGPDWTETTDGNAATDMSTDGDFATIDTSGATHLAVIAGTRAIENFVSCWVRKPNAGQNVGIILRWVSAWAYYEIVLEELFGVQYLSLYRGNGFGIRPLLARTDVTVWYLDNVWARIDAEIVGSRVRAWVSQPTFTFHPPQIDFTDTQPAAVGDVGIISSTNNAGGIGTVLWNDFCARSRGTTADTIWVDYNHQAGAPGYGYGSETVPDTHLGRAINNIGARRGSTINLVNAAIQSSVLEDWEIEDEKFSGAFSFPTYDFKSGAELTSGAPNLTIESAAAGGRTEIDNQNDGAFFNIGTDATGILFRGLDYIHGGFAAANARFIDTDLSTDDHSLAIHKCSWMSTTAIGGASQAAVRIRTFFESFECRYCYAYHNPVGVSFANAGIEFLANTDLSPNLTFWASIIRGADVGVADTFHGVIFQTVGPPAGSRWSFDHNLFYNIQHSNVFVPTFGINFLGWTGVDGTIEILNNIFANETGANPMMNGTGAFVPGAAPGRVGAHHNTYFNVTNPRGTLGVVNDDGNEIASVQEPFTLPLGNLTWQQAMDLLTQDFTPIAADYQANASDVEPGLGVLDRGPIQDYIAPVPVLGRRGPSFCVKVIYNPGEPGAFDLSTRFIKHRPLVQQKDILLRKYRASDTELEFADPGGLFVDTNPASFLTDALGNRTWRGVPVQISYFDRDGVELTRYLGFVLGVRAGPNQGFLRLGNRFQFLFGRPLLANDAGRIEDDADNASVAGDIGLAGTYMSDAGVGAGCGIEEWEIRFTGAAAFEVRGSVTGVDGTGTTGANFVSDSGAVAFAAADWINLPLTPGNSCKIRTVWRSSTATSIIELYEELLLSAEGGGLVAGDLDASVDDLKGSTVDRAILGCVFDDALKVIDAMEEICLHALAVATEKDDATIGIYAYIPQIIPTVTDVLCKDRELIAAMTNATPIYNQFRYAYDYDEIEREFDEGRVFPDPLLSTPGDEIIAAPRTISLRAFSDSNAAWVTTLGQQNLTRWSEPRQIVNVRLKADRVGVEIDDVWVVDSDLPNVLQVFEAAKIQKTLAPEPFVDMELYEVGFYFQPEDACGYAFTDSGHQCDNCWVCF